MVRKLHQKSTPQTGSQPPQADQRTLRPPAWHHALGCSAPSSLHSPPPRTSLRSPLCIVPRLRPPQEPRAPACGTGFVPQPVPPAPDPQRSLWECASGTSIVSAERVGSRCRLRALSASSVVLVTPGASALLRRLCSLVAPAGTLDPAPSGGKRLVSFRLSPKQVGSTCWAGQGRRSNRVRSAAQPCSLGEATLLDRGGAWVSGVVGWASQVRASSVRAERRRGSGARSPHNPQPSPALGAGGSASANASPPLHRPTHGNREGG